MMIALYVLLMMSGEVLTNEDVVKLVKAGLSPATIEAKIEKSRTAFDTSTDALVVLAKEGVPDSVIRAMIGRKSARPVSPPPSSTSSRASKRFDVAVHRSKYAKCDTGELRIDGKGAKSTHCGKGIDFELAWSDVKAICYDYGFRGTVVFRTATGEQRISTTTPAEAKKIVATIRELRPSLEQREGCD